MILLQLIILAVLIYIIYLLLYSMLKGAPYAAIGQDRLKIVIDLLAPKKNKLHADLGSGDGRIVMAIARKGAISVGYEINPLIYLLSKFNIKKTKLKNASVKLSDYWREDLSKFDYITIWGTPLMMSRLEKKLDKESRKGTRIVSNHNKFPNWELKKAKNDVYLYIKK